MPIRVQGDFNGLNGDILCLSHEEWVLRFDSNGVRNRSDVSPESLLLEFLRVLASGGGTKEQWERTVVAHSSHRQSEDARQALARAAIDAGEWAWPSVPASLRGVASELSARLTSS